MNEDYKPRLAFEITEEQRTRLDQLLATYGIRKAIFSKVLDDILDLVESHGGMAIGILMSKNVKPRDILPSLHKVESVGQVEDKGE